MSNAQGSSPQNSVQRQRAHVVQVGRRVDAFCFNDFKAACEKALGSGNKLVVLDFAGTQFLSLPAIQFIEGMFFKMREQSGEVLLLSMAEKLKRQVLVYSHRDLKDIFRRPSELDFLN